MARKDVNFKDITFNEFVEELWLADVNRLEPGKDFKLDTQAKRKRKRDNAPNPLFSHVSMEALQKPTFKAFIDLLDNYEASTGVTENVTDEEIAENWRFINLIFQTPCMKLCYQFLRDNGKIEKNEEDFKQDFYHMWFDLYRRDKSNDSCGFEHVFVGETRRRKTVLGFHNWIQFYLQEKICKVNYRGYITSDKNPYLLSINFSWKGVFKPKGGSLIGVSPEFEISLYTLCHLMGRSTYKITLGGEPLIIETYKMPGGKIGTSFPKMIN